MGNPSTTTTTTASTVAAAATAAATAAAPAASRSLYLAWTHFQRRQVSMADLAGFECVFLPLAYKGRSHLLRGLHYLRLMLRTVQVLRQHRPAVLWLQLPQFPLLWAAMLYRLLFDPALQLVADCHNAAFQAPWSRLPLGLSLLRRCTCILVHNDDMRARAQQLGLPMTRVQVLEDVPPLHRGGTRGVPVPPAFAGRPRPWVLFPGSYGQDEPIGELLAAAAMMPAGTLAVTGRRSNATRNGHDISQVPANTVLTDYVPVAELDALLAHADVVLALTRNDGIQLSVCNEALGFGKPMVMSGTPLLRALFGSAAVVVDSSDPADILRGIGQAWQARDHWGDAAESLAHQRRSRWVAEPLQRCLRVLDARVP
ncbi:MAG: glycosyltransferase [Rubrivivax sp.]|nr:glycosyltransferase [Rubrivivax sp.]